MLPKYAKSDGVTLVGGGALDRATLERALTRAPHLVAADGGADRALALGRMPELAVGDLDSLSDRARDALGPDRLLRNDDQETTDFDKALAAVQAPMVLAVGFAGARLDHTLAAMGTLARHPDRRVILDTGHDLCLLAPPRLALDLAIGTRVSLFPLAAMSCASTGLRWQTDPLHFDPLGRLGTSNEAAAPRITLTPARPAMLLLLPVETLDALLTGLRAAPAWPAPARAR